MPAGLAQRLRSLTRIASLVNRGSELADVLDRVVLALCQRSRWSSSAIMAVDRDSGYSVLAARHDPHFEIAPAPHERWLLATSPTLQVLERKRPLVIPDAQESTEFPGYRHDARERDYRTVVLLPLEAIDERGRRMVMSVHAHERHAVDADELAFLEAAAQLASLAVDKAHRLRGEQENAKRLRRALAAHTASMEQVLAGRPLHGVLEVIADFLPYPLLVVDLTANAVMAQRSPRPERMTDAEWAAHMARLRPRALGALVEAARPANFAERRRLAGPVLDLPFEVEGVVEPFIVDGAVLGGMILFTAGEALDPFDALVAEEARFTLAVQLMRAHIALTARAETHAELFGRLFSGNWRDRGETLARARHLGLRLDEPARLLLLAEAPAAGGASSEARRADLQRGLLRIAAGQAPGATAFFDGDALVVFLPEGEHAAGAAAPFVQRLLDEAQWIARAKFVAVASRPCRTLEDYRSARQDGGRLLALARRLGRNGLVTEADFGPFARLLAAADQAALRAFVGDTLGRIEAHDRKHRSELLPTLESFLANSCRYQACADALGIHVTTLRYRLRRLNELFGIDLDAPDARVTLEVALRVRAAVGAP